MFCAPTWEVQKPAADGHFFTLCFLGRIHGDSGWPADTRTRGATLRGNRAPAKAGNRSGPRALGEQRRDRFETGDVGGHGAAGGPSLRIPPWLRPNRKA